MSTENISTEAQPADSNQDVQQESVENNIENTEVQKEEKAQEKLLKKFKLKVDGEEIEEEVDLNDDQRLIKALQMEKVAKKRMQEANEEKRKAYELAKLFDQDPAGLLKRLGPKGFEIAEQILLEKLQDESLSPEEREFRKMKQEYENLKKEKEQREELERQRVEQERETKIAQEIQTTIINALKKAEVPTSPKAIQRMAQLYKHNINLGLNLDADDLADEYKKEVLGDLDFVHKGTSIDQLISILGKERMKELRDYDLRKYKEKQKIGQFKKPSDMKAPPPPKKSDYISPDQWLEETRRRAKEE